MWRSRREDEDAVEDKDGVEDADVEEDEHAVEDEHAEEDGDRSVLTARGLPAVDRCPARLAAPSPPSL